MTFTSIASSSHGNCYVLYDSQTKLLLECGISIKRIRRHVDLSNVRACLLSHEHKDHSKAVREILKSGVPVYASQGTADALDCSLISPVAHLGQFQIGSLDVIPFNVFHDAAEPLGYLVHSRLDEDRLVFATDTVNLNYRFPGVNLLALECNYSAQLLAQCKKLPDKLRKRISNTHMEINTLCNYLQALDLSSCRSVYLLHLSRAASSAGDFVRRVRFSLPPGVEVIACEE